MKLLILTQKVDLNDDVLGFFHDWLLEFSKLYENITVVCLQVGEFQLPDNIKVLSLGKESKASRLKYVFRFYKYIWQERKKYDKVFVHMNPEYVVLGGLLWKLWQKKIGLWYVHKAVNLKLRIATFFTDIIFTASKESFLLRSDKVMVVGHGVMISDFRLKNSECLKNENFEIIYVGRVSSIKNQKLLIEALDILINKKGYKNIIAKFIGPTVYSADKKYLEECKSLLMEKNLANYVNFSGSVPFQKMPAIYSTADIFVNLCPTGGVDKAVIESMACGVPPIVLNEAFLGILPEQDLILKESDKNELADKIEYIMKMELSKLEKIENHLQEIVKKDFSLEKLIRKIVGLL